MGTSTLYQTKQDYDDIELDLQADSTYYATVRAINFAGLSATLCSDGVKIGASAVDVSPDLGGSFMMDARSAKENKTANTTGSERPKTYASVGIPAGALETDTKLTATSLPDDVYLSYYNGSGVGCCLKYCNAHQDLMDLYCGGAKCAEDAQAAPCLAHYHRTGRAQGLTPDPTESCSEYEDPATSPPPDNFQFGDYSFAMWPATPDDDGVQFAKPISFELYYASEVQDGQFFPLPQLMMWSVRNKSWVNAAETCSPPRVENDPEKYLLTVHVCHLTQFGLVTSTSTEEVTSGHICAKPEYNLTSHQVLSPCTPPSPPPPSWAVGLSTREGGSIALQSFFEYSKWSIPPPQIYGK